MPELIPIFSVESHENYEPKMKNTIIAIDPGASGGIAIRDKDATADVCHAMWQTEGDIVEGLRAARFNDNGQPVAYVEQVGGYVAGCVAPGSAMFTFGRGFGFLLGCLQSMEYKVVIVQSKAWQKTVGVGSKGDMTTTKWKNKLKQRAQQLYPSLKVTLKTADALLILEHAKKVEGI